MATVLTLIFLPALYVAWFRIREPSVRDTLMQAEEGQRRQVVKLIDDARA